MSQQPDVRIMTYASSHTAQIARAALEADGIRSVTVGDDSNASHALLGGAAQEVHLLVSKDQIEPALAILERLEREWSGNRFSQWDSERNLGWVCSGCGEVNEHSFDECWSCEAVRPANPELAPLPDDDQKPRIQTTESAVVTSNEADDSPYRVPASLTLGTVVEVAADDGLERRLLRSVIVSLIVPPLSIYTFYLVGRCFAAGRTTTATFWICAALVAVIWMVFLLVVAVFVWR
ncbi:MAG: hypothetical protein R3C19_00125 [Planctomycetaceae bacterium]